MGGGGGTTDGGVDAGAPDHLAFATSAQVLYASTCSQPLTVETRNVLNQPTSVQAATLVGFSASSGGVTFYRDSMCSLATTNATIPLGASGATVFFRAILVGSPAIAAAAPGLTPTSQIETVVAPPSALAIVSPLPPAPVIPGSCFQATVEARRGITPAVLLTDAPVALQTGLVGGLRFYSDASCTASVIGVMIVAGQSRQSFFVKPISGGLNSLIATATFGTATQQFSVVGLVRRGQCQMSTPQTQINCPITPTHQSMSKTVVVYQATASSSEPYDSEVRCRLSLPDMLTCERAGANATAVVAWQTAELATGLTVQRGFAPSCGVGLSLATPINPAGSFVLSSFTGVGLNFDGDDLWAARLSADGGAVLLDNSSGQGCSGYEFQVVELSGVTTLRGATTDLNVGLRQAQVTMLPAASPNTVLFNQALLSAAAIPDSTSMCHLLVRGEMPSPTSLLFSRGGNNPQTFACTDVPITQIAWERVDFGARARVQTATVTFSNNSLDVPILSVDTTRTLVFAGGQLSGGQASGETAVDTIADDAIGPGMARFELINATTVRLTRGSTLSSGTFTFYVVELEP